MLRLQVPQPLRPQSRAVGAAGSARRPSCVRWAGVSKDDPGDSLAQATPCSERPGDAADAPGAGRLPLRAHADPTPAGRGESTCAESWSQACRKTWSCVTLTLDTACAGDPGSATGTLTPTHLVAREKPQALSVKPGHRAAGCFLLVPQPAGRPPALRGRGSFPEAPPHPEHWREMQRSQERSP